MGLRPTFTFDQVRANLAQRVEGFEKAVINTLSYMGEACVSHARSVNTYRDQTGNLRNSIGYVIVKDGSVLKSNFRRSAVVLKVTKLGRSYLSRGNKNGTAEAQALALKLASGLTGYRLIVVAGMNYALSVESRGLDVLSSAEQLAKSQLPGLLKQLKL